MAETLSLKALPYGTVDFSAIRYGNFAYVDKTRYIELLENFGIRNAFIIRPRRFGKTLFTSVLEAYYDEWMARDFDANFKGTYIGEHKTPLASCFRTLHLDFSGLSSASDLSLRFQTCVKNSIVQFFNKYPHPKQDEILQQSFSDASSLIETFFSLLQAEYKQKIYVIIDEYDQFANEILSRDVDEFKSITSDQGFYKDFFSALKKATFGAVGRVFITGVSSFSLDSFTSGFNIATNISTEPLFAGMFGFTEVELRSLILQTIDLKQCKLDLDDVVSFMKDWYNGYRFSSEATETVFNSTMCLYFLSILRMRGHYPEEMLDSNLGQNLSKFEGILSFGDKTQINAILQSAMNGEAIPFKSKPSDLNLNKLKNFSRNEILSILFTFGFLTYNEGERASLVIPNRAIQAQFFAYYLAYIMDAEEDDFNFEEFDVVKRKLIEGDFKAFFDFVCKPFNVKSGIHSYAHLQEGEFQTLLFSAFLLTGLYEVRREAEIESVDKGYADLLAIPKAKYATLPSYLIEFKYISKDKASANEIEEAITEATKQLKRYAQGENIRAIANLKKLLCVFVGLKLEVLEVVD